MAPNPNRGGKVPGGDDSCAAGCLATLLPAEQTLRSLSGSDRGGPPGQTAGSIDRANSTADATTNATASLAKSDFCHAAFSAVGCSVSTYGNSSLDHCRRRWAPYPVQRWSEIFF